MTGLTILLRVLHLGSAIFLVGSFTFPLLVARAASRLGVQGHEPAVRPFDHRLYRWRVWGLLGFVGTGVLGLWGQVAVVTKSPLWPLPPLVILGDFLTDTEYGRVWLLRLLLAVCLGTVLVLHAWSRHGPLRWGRQRVGVGLAGGLLVTQAWAGHAAAAEGMTYLLQVTVHMLHLLAAGVWLGSLPLLVVFLTWARQADHASTAGLAAEVTRRFSTLGLGSVLLLVVTGVASAWALVGNIAALLGTPYGQLLLSKVGLLLFLCGPAAANLCVEKPRLLRVVAAQQWRQTSDTLRRLRRNVLLEAVLGLAILLVVGGLGVNPPARHVPPTWPLSFRLSWTATRDLPGVPSRVLLGGLVGLGGLLACGCATRRHRWWRATAGVGVIAGITGLWSVIQAIAIDAYPPTYLRPTVPYQALSIANGLRLYQEHCAVCHGLAGYGDGPAAAALTPRPADLTAKHTAHHTVGDLFWWLSYGIKGSAMPGFEGRLSEEERWDVINFLRTLAAAEQARALAAQPESAPWLVAPDFSYTTATGETQTLKDQRGRHLVLLVFFRLPASQRRLVELYDLTPQLQRLQVQVLAVPLHTEQDVLPPPETSAGLVVVTDGATEAAITYTLFRKSLSPTGRLPIPPFPAHVEFLIDRQGYVRARWLPGSDPGWARTEDLLATIAWLNQEKPRTAAPDEHIH
jgi:copper resistance protein D